MAGFQYIQRPIVPNVDLETLGNTFNTLEEGHQAAVKAASDLEIAVAQLPMDTIEDDFKEQLIGEIKNTVDENTLYGNTYGALDNLVAQAGNIQSDGRVIGRLRNHKAKVEYDAKVDAMAIPEGMKQMYKEQNPYEYVEGSIDAKTGRYLPGELWKPKTSPVTTIPDTEIQKYALQIAAKEAGGNEHITFLDEFGKETSDPSKSVDGAFYRKLGTKYQRLEKEKIDKAYRIAIASIPGAWDSLKQDYNYATYQHGKLVEDARQKGGDITPYLPGYTDKNGNVYDEKQWLDNKINNFADVAAYDYNYSTVNFGDALQNRKAAQRKGNGGGGGQTLDFVGSVDLGTYEVKQNAYSSALNARNTASKSGLDIINRIASDKFKETFLGDIQDRLIKEGKATGPSTAAQYIINTYGQNLTPTEKVTLTNSFITTWKTNEQVKTMIKAAGADADALRFSDNINSQEYTNDNKYGKSIIEELNDTFKNNSQIDYEIGKDVFDTLTRLYNVNDLRQIGINYTKNSNDIYTVTFTPNNRNLLPKFDSYIVKADNQVRGNFGGWLKNKVTGKAASGNYVVKLYNKDGNININNFDSLRTWGNLYEKGEEAAAKIQDKVGGFTGTKNLLGTNISTPGEEYWMDIGAQTGMSGAEIRANQEACKKRVDAAIATGNLAGGQVYLVGDPEDIKSPRRFNNQVANATKLNLLLQHMYSVNPNNINRVYSPGDDQIPEGFYFSFTVPANDKNAITEDYRGKTINMYVTGAIDDGSNYNINDNPRYVAQNFVGTSKATGAPIENIGYSRSLGDTRLIINDDYTFNSNLFGQSVKLNEQQAELITEQLIRLEQTKMQIPNLRANTNISDKDKIELLQNHIDNYAISIGRVLGISQEIVAMSIANYFNEPFE